ncbi:MAG: pyridoxamine kinase [Bacteroidales bacterium]|jgi:pyridoxine kinase
MSSEVKKIAAIHDICGYGRSSLTVVIPILSSMGFYVCPIPTALLSTSTAYPDLYVVDLTAHLQPIMDHWKKLKLNIETIYSGYLGSPEQCKIVSKFIDDFSESSNLIIVDPVLGDSGELYDTMDKEMITSMRNLIGKANLITPNLTEACLLTDIKYKSKFTKSEIEDIVLKLSEMGPEKVIVTGIPYNNNEETLVAAYNKENKIFYRSCKYIPAEYPGTGDTFTSVVCGSLMQGATFENAVDKATKFVFEGISLTYKYNSDQREGIFQELILKKLNS